MYYYTILLNSFVIILINHIYIVLAHSREFYVCQSQIVATVCGRSLPCHLGLCNTVLYLLSINPYILFNSLLKIFYTTVLYMLLKEILCLFFHKSCVWGDITVTTLVTWHCVSWNKTMKAYFSGLLKILFYCQEYRNIVARKHSMH